MEQIDLPGADHRRRRYFASQSDTLFDALKGRKELKRFTEAEGAGGHCEGLGATLFEEAVFDWLTSTLSRD